MVQDVGKGALQPYRNPLGRMEALIQAHVTRLSPRPHDNAGSRVAESPVGRSCKRRCIEPSRDRTLIYRQVPVADPIWNAADGIGIGRIGSGEGGCKEISGL